MWQTSTNKEVHSNTTMRKIDSLLFSINKLGYNLLHNNDFYNYLWSGGEWWKVVFLVILRSKKFQRLRSIALEQILGSRTCMPIFYVGAFLVTDEKLWGTTKEICPYG